MHTWNEWREEFVTRNAHGNSQTNKLRSNSSTFIRLRPDECSERHSALVISLGMHTVLCGLHFRRSSYTVCTHRSCSLALAPAPAQLIFESWRVHDTVDDAMFKNLLHWQVSSGLVCLTSHPAYTRAGTLFAFESDRFSEYFSFLSTENKSNQMTTARTKLCCPFYARLIQHRNLQQSNRRDWARIAAHTKHTVFRSPCKMWNGNNRVTVGSDSDPSSIKWMKEQEKWKKKSQTRLGSGIDQLPNAEMCGTNESSQPFDRRAMCRATAAGCARIYIFPVGECVRRTVSRSPACAPNTTITPRASWPV